jgi:hypothetical protein
MVVLTYVASAIRNGTPELESFPRFYEHWLLEQNKYLEDLISVSKLHNKSIDTNTSQTSTLINQVIEHYEHYYEVMSRWAKQYVLGMLTPSWTSTLEEGFMWIGGWRPTMAFHLLYSKSGLQLEDQLADFIRGLSTGDLGDLSPTQLNQVDKLHSKTIKEERNISEKMAKHQETVADSSVVEFGIDEEWWWWR